VAQRQKTNETKQIESTARN